MTARGVPDRLSQILCGEGSFTLFYLIEGARGYDFAAVNTCSGAKVDYSVGMAHGTFIVFYHDEGVASIP